jgi:hypothetical protein
MCCGDIDYSGDYAFFIAPELPTMLDTLGLAAALHSSCKFVPGAPPQQRSPLRIGMSRAVGLARRSGIDADRNAKML